MRADMPRYGRTSTPSGSHVPSVVRPADQRRATRGKSTTTGRSAADRTSIPVGASSVDFAPYDGRHGNTARAEDRNLVSREPAPAVLYPDVAAHGSLAAALHAAAAGQGLSLPLAVTPSDPLRHTTIASVVPHRHSSYVS